MRANLFGSEIEKRRARELLQLRATRVQIFVARATCNFFNFKKWYFKVFLKI
jgi:hypothetical protein